MEKVTELIKEINNSVSNLSSSAKDEERVMRCMLNDTTYSVGVYTKEGKVGEYCPAQEAQQLAANIIAGATRVSKSEAQVLASNYEFGKQDANIMIGVAKEFVNTMLETGRKVSFGGREDYEIAIAHKHEDERVKKTPKLVGYDEHNEPVYNRDHTTTIPAFTSGRMFSSCPEWVKNKNK